MLPILPFWAATAFAVVGGEDASLADWPGFASVVYASMPSAPICGAVLIAPRVALTTASCVSDDPDSVLVNVADLSEQGTLVEIEAAHVVQDFPTAGDLAVLILAEDAPGPYATLGLGTDLDGLVDGAVVSLVGFGATDSDATTFPTRMQQGDTVVVDADCGDAAAGCMSGISPGAEIVAGGDGVDACPGDAGGPLVLHTERGDRVVGLTSRGVVTAATPCGEGSIFTRLDAHEEWIEEVSGLTLGPADGIEDSKACGCAATGPVGLLPSLLPLLALGRRRSRRSAG